MKTTIYNLLFFLCFTLTVFCKFNCRDIHRTSTVHDLQDIEDTTPSKREEPLYEKTRIELNFGRLIHTTPKAMETFTLASTIIHNIIENTLTETPIFIDADLDILSNGILGSTNSVNIIASCRSPYGVIPTPIRQITGIKVPACSQLKYDTTGTYDEKMTFTKANLKALGRFGLDNYFGRSDGSIKFSTRIDFDFDISDGIDSQKTVFLFVVLHEMIHLLGFISSLDELDYGSTVFRPTLLDIYRFEKKDDIDFAEDYRMGTPKNSNQVFYIDAFDRLNISNFPRLSTGYFLGDGNQASHWADNEIYNLRYGIMDPTLGRGEAIHISMYDIRALKSIGYKVKLALKPVIYYAYIQENHSGRYVRMISDYLYGNCKCNFSGLLVEIHENPITGYNECRIPHDRESFLFTVIPGIGIDYSSDPYQITAS